MLGWERWREVDAEHFGRFLPAALEAAMRQGLIAEQPVEPLARLLLGAATEAAGRLCRQRHAAGNRPRPRRGVPIAA